MIITAEELNERLRYKLDITDIRLDIDDTLVIAILPDKSIIQLFRFIKNNKLFNQVVEAIKVWNEIYAQG